MADSIMEIIFKKDIFTWHRSNMIKPNAIRTAYITALKKVDNGDISSLIKFAKKITMTKRKYYRTIIH